MKSPVLFLIFNRPEEASATFASIRQTKPPRLYIAADGPRPDRPEEAALCEQARMVAKQVDWPCEVKTLFRKRNLGCGMAVSSAITWFFQQEAEGIILEDDLTPEQGFFTFCDELLDRYRQAENIMHIAGNNFQFGKRHSDASYYFSLFPHCWGWATWARAWKFFDFEMRHTANFIAQHLPKLVPDTKSLAYWQDIFSKTKNGAIDSWAYRWQYSIWKNNGLCILPEHNLVKNFGFAGNATHTTKKNIVDNLETFPMEWPLVHPLNAEQCRVADNFSFNTIFTDRGTAYRSFVEECITRIDSGKLDEALYLIGKLQTNFGLNNALVELEALALAKAGKHSEALQKAKILLASSAPEGRKLLERLEKMLDSKKFC